LVPLPPTVGPNVSLRDVAVVLGEDVGASVGWVEGPPLGEVVGADVGASVGWAEGPPLGEVVGADVGALRGVTQSAAKQHLSQNLKPVKPSQ